jgi:hypothetical protein
MNTEQIGSHVRLVLNLLAGILGAHGFKESSLVNGPDAIALGILLVTFIWGHVKHSDDPTAPPPFKKFNLFFGLIVTVLVLTACAPLKNKQVLEKSTVLGFQAVSPGQADMQVKIQIGLVRNEYFSNPTSTNAVYAAPWASHVKADLKMTEQTADETFSTVNPK